MGLARAIAVFDGLLDCAAGPAEKSACIDGWRRDIGDLVPATQRPSARGMLDYYFETSLRVDSAKLAGRCGT
ncbi:hypothetical protein [Arenimonas sp.]|uniref:hypothetical protein n=1 Tax=Arenimonas sp. TaxID=1872635 RepID=UPI0039E4786A